MSKAFIAKIDRIVPIEGADNIQIGIVLGECVVVSKTWEVGKVGVFFPPDTQLSELYCSSNNLFRDKTQNADQEKAGFFDKNRKVRCQPFMKVKSEGFFAELDSLACISKDYYDIPIGTEFDEIDGVQLCCKFISEKTRKAIQNQQKQKKKLVLTPDFAEHVNTSQFKYEAGAIPTGALLSFHAKVHGTSARYGYTKLVKELPWWKKTINKLLPLFSEYVWDYVVGTRRVVIFDEKKEGFNGSEQYRFDVLRTLKPFLEKGMCVYGEIAGYANTNPIMTTHNTSALKNKEFRKKYGETITYKYGCAEHQNRFHVYRITTTNEDGVTVDYTPQQISAWCESKGILAHLDVHPPMIYDGDVEALKSLVEELTERPALLGEDYIDPTHLGEGIIVRVDDGRLTPKFYKSKSYAFRVLEGIAKEDEVDTEDAA